MYFLSQIETVISPEMLHEITNTPIADWQLNIVTLTVAAMFLGRIYSYLRTNGGIKNIVKAVWEGGVVGTKTQGQVDIMKNKLAELEQKLQGKEDKS